MDIGLTRQDPEPPDAVSSPFAVWVWDALEVAFDQVLRHSGLAVQRQKRLYDQRAVRRLFAIGDWVMRYYPAAKKCKLDSVWLGPSLVVSIVGWAVGIQKHLDSPILLIHCQDVKKVPQPSGVRSWITTPPPVSAPTVPVLGASTIAHTSQYSPSVDVLPPDEGVVLAEVDSAGVQSASGSQVSGRSRMDVDGSRMGVSSSSVSSAGIPFTASILRMYVSCVLHPFTLHKLDAGPIRLMTIAHAFNYRELGMPPSDGEGGGGVMTRECSGVEPCSEMGRPGSVPFVSDRPGAYGRLLLSVCVWWRTGVLVPSNWLSPVTWGGWRTGSHTVCAVQLTSAD